MDDDTDVAAQCELTIGARCTLTSAAVPSGSYIAGGVAGQVKTSGHSSVSRTAIFWSELSERQHSEPFRDQQAAMGALSA